MQNKKLLLIAGVLILAAGAAAFVGGRLLNQGVGSLGLAGMPASGDMISFSLNVVPAEELPTTPPELMGLFVERQDNTLVVSAVPLQAAGGGAVLETRGEAVPGSRVDVDSGTRTEVVVTTETIIYRETTELGSFQPGENQTVQQTVEESTLDELSSQSMITVWGRKSGDRIIAEVLFYSNPVTIQVP